MKQSKQLRRRRKSKSRSGQVATGAVGLPVDTVLTEAVALHQAGQLEPAIEKYRAVLQADPRNPDAHHLLGVAAYQSQDNALAIQLISTAIQLNPTVGDYYLNLGSAHQSAGNIDEAVDAFLQCLNLNPQSALANNNLANALKQQGKTLESLEYYRTSLKLNPNSALAHCNYGAALVDLNELQEASNHLERALELDSNLSEAANNRAIICARLGEYEQAISAYTSLLGRQPRLASAWRNLGNTLNECCRTEEAQTAFEHAFEICQEPQLKLRAATLCPSVMPTDTAIDQFREQVSATLTTFENASVQFQPNRLVDSNCQPPFYLPYHGKNDRAIKERYGKLFQSSFPQTDPKPVDGPTHVCLTYPPRREAVFLRFMLGIVERLCGDDLHLTIAGPPQGNTRIANRLRQSPTNLRFVNTPTKIHQTAEVLRTVGAHILFHFEVGTDSFGYFLPYYNLAPIQCTSWGVPVTTGIPGMNYFISSQLLEGPDAESHYSEQLVRLETMPVHYARPTVAGDRFERDHWGFTADQNLYLCPQSLFKFHPQFDEALRSILRNDPQGQLVLIEAEYQPWTELLRQRFEQTMPDVANRVAFVPRQSQEGFSSLLQCCDVVLDPLHFGGGATTYEALGVGVPIVTLPGTYMRGRVTAGCYAKMGMTQCIASSIQEYTTLANELATDKDRQHQTRSEIRARNETLFEDRQAVDQLREFFHSAAQTAR